MTSKTDNTLPYHKIRIVSAYLKTYPQFHKLITYEYPIKIQQKIKKKKSKNPNTELSQLDSIRRSKRLLTDITLANEFDMFITFTFDPKKVKNRYDPDLLKKHMSQWLKNQRQLYGQFRYIIVPEHHKDGALHFHALFADYKGHYAPYKNPKTGKTKTSHGNPLYTLTGYRLGYSSLSIIPKKDIPKVSSYVRKYIMKEMPIFHGKKRYFCSQGLDRPHTIPNPIIHPSDLLKFIPIYENDKFTMSQTNARIALPEQSVIIKP